MNTLSILYNFGNVVQVTLIKEEFSLRTVKNRLIKEKEFCERAECHKDKIPSIEEKIKKENSGDLCFYEMRHRYKPKISFSNRNDDISVDYCDLKTKKIITQEEYKQLEKPENFNEYIEKEKLYPIYMYGVEIEGLVLDRRFSHKYFFLYKKDAEKFLSDIKEAISDFYKK